MRPSARNLLPIWCKHWKFLTRRLLWPLLPAAIMILYKTGSTLISHFPPISESQFCQTMGIQLDIFVLTKNSTVISSYMSYLHWRLQYSGWSTGEQSTRDLVKLFPTRNLVKQIKDDFSFNWHFFAPQRIPCISDNSFIVKEYIMCNSQMLL